MKTFKEGDRVSHPTHGEGTVTTPRYGTGWPTVQFDSGEKIMTTDRLLTPVPQTTAPFKNGDRVIHSLHGPATVTGVAVAQKLVEIVPNGGGTSFYVHPTSLTLASEGAKFKIGDRVSHPLHRDGTVDHYSEHSGLYTVDIGGGRAYFALEHQITAAKPEPKFMVRVMFTDGAGLNSYDPMVQQHAEAYLTQLPDWDNVESITITRAKG